MSDRIDSWTLISSQILSFEIEGIYFYVLLVLQEHEDREKMEVQLTCFKQSLPKIKNLIAPFMKIE